jgi:MEMO1 family protein
MRQSIASGTFYENDFNKLNSQIELSFEQGPGSTPFNERNKKVLAVIVPSLDYKNSGKCLAWAYKEIAESKLPSTYIILGTLHKYLSDKLLISNEDFNTSFGLVKNNRNISERLLDQNIIINNIVHKEENSIELQLPFLQYINQKHLEKVKILPLLSSTLNLTLIKEFAKKLSTLNDVIFIVSSNLLHYGKRYNFSPFKYNAVKEADNISGGILNSIINLDTKTFLRIIEETSAPIYGASSIAILLETLKLKNIQKGKLLYNKRYSEEENFIDLASIIYNET